MTDYPHEIVGVVHYAGQYKDRAPGWHVFTDYLFADGGEICVADNGPFASKDAAQICVDLAGDVEEITSHIVGVARRNYLRRVLQ